MRRALALLAGLLFATNAAADWTLPGVREAYKYATLFVEVERENKVITTGSGVVISDSGYVLTARHLLECYDCRAAQFWARVGKRDGERIAMQYVNEENMHDLALFRLESSAKWGKPPPIGKQVEPGKPLFVLGFPGEDDFTGYDGKLGNDTQPGGRWHTDLKITEGNSGGPVFDGNGTLVGIALSGRRGEEGMKTVAPIKLAERLLAFASVKLPEGSGMPGAETVNVFIDDSQLGGTDRDAVSALKSFVRRLGRELSAIRLAASKDEATYMVTLTDLRAFGQQHLSLSGSFRRAGENERIVTGKCLDKRCSSEKDGPHRAFKDFLEMTLLHPVNGYYRLLRIARCDPDTDTSMMRLHLRWNTGPGPDDSLLYEVGELKNKDETSPSHTGLYITPLEITSMSKDEAKGRFRALNRGYSLRACATPGEAAGDEVLMVRLLQRLPEDDAQNANFRSLR